MISRTTYRVIWERWRVAHGRSTRWRSRRCRSRRWRITLVVSLLVALASCQSEQIVRKPYTHTETDIYTIAERDTMFYESVHNVPGRPEDSASVVASSRTRRAIGETTSRDSSHDRNYPNFLRAGGIEIAGLIGSGGTNGIGTGLFGLYGLFDKDIVSDKGGLWATSFSPIKQTSSAHMTKGELVRIMPVEYRLRWFDDAPNWTVGWSAFEMITPDEILGHHALISTGSNVYVRRRIYLRDQIPYVFFNPLLGVSLFPSAYVNLGGELTVGSLGGMNVRAYAGIASGFQWAHATDGATFPYFGLGVSALDFVNRVEETEHEWKDYVRTTMDVNIIDATLLKPLSSFNSPFGSGAGNYGWDIRLATVEIPLPILNGNFWGGTSLLHYAAVGVAEQAIGVLPLRGGYRQRILTDDVMLEPFLELNYYPSQLVNLGLRLKIDLESGMSLGLTAGYMTGTAGNYSPQMWSYSWPKSGSSFSTAYLGIDVYIGDWTATPEAVRDARARELPSTLQ